MRMDQGGHCHVNGSFPVQNNHFRKVRHIADALTVVPPFNMWKQSPAFLDITFGPIPSSIWHDRSSLIITNYLRRVEKRPSWSFTALGALWVGDLRFLLLETATVAWWAGQVQDPLEQFVLFLWDVQRHLKFFDVLWALKPCIWMHMNAYDCKMLNALGEMSYLSLTLAISTSTIRLPLLRSIQRRFPGNRATGKASTGRGPRNVFGLWTRSLFERWAR